MTEVYWNSSSSSGEYEKGDVDAGSDDEGNAFDESTVSQFGTVTGPIILLTIGMNLLPKLAARLIQFGAFPPHSV